MTKKPKPASRHALAENINYFGTIVRLSPLGLIQYAEYFLLAARSTQAPETAPHLPIVRTFLACRALELAFKAFLALKGRSLVELRGGPFGHNLKNLIVEAQKRDLQALIKLSDDQCAEIIRASEYYSEKVLEYPSLIEALSAFPKMPNPDILIGAVDALVGALHEPCLHAE